MSFENAKKNVKILKAIFRNQKMENFASKMCENKSVKNRSVSVNKKKWIFKKEERKHFKN